MNFNDVASTTQVSCTQPKSVNKGKNTTTFVSASGKAMTSSWTERQLFGGAITCNLPSHWRDVSDVRDVPDHQEVFQDISSTRDPCFIIEILARHDGIDGDPAQFFFRDLSEANASVESKFSVLDENLIHDPPPMCIISSGVGIQKIHRGRDTDYEGNPRELTFEYINIELCVLRLKHLQTDLLMTLSCTMSNYSEVQTSFSDNFRRMLSTITIRDFGLFGEDKT